MNSPILRPVLLPLVACVVLLAAPAPQEKDKKKPLTPTQKIEELETQVRQLLRDLKGCQQEKDAYRETAKFEGEALAIAKERDLAVEAARKSDKEVKRLEGVVSDLQAKAGAAVPAGPSPEEAAKHAKDIQDAQKGLQDAQKDLVDAQDANRKLKESAAVLGVQLQKLNEDLASTRTTLTTTQNTLKETQDTLDSTKKVVEEQKLAYEDLTKEHNTTKKALANTKDTLTKTQDELTNMKADRKRWFEVATNTLDGALVHLTPQIVPARPLNIEQVRPPRATGLTERVKGVIVVSCWVDAKGKVKSVRMIQPLPGSSYDVKELNRAYQDAATRLVFEPAMSSDGSKHFQVWQGVGFLVDE